MVNQTGYKYTKQWYQFVFETKEMVRPIHAALYFWIVEKNNQLNWKKVFGLPTAEAMQATNVSGYQHYKKALNDLIKWKLINLVAKSHNQHTCNQITLNLLYTKSTKQGIKQVRHNKTIKNLKTSEPEKIVETVNINPIPYGAH